MKAWLVRGWVGWKGLATYIGTFQARLLLTFVYFSWLVPFGLVLRLFSDPLDTRGADQPGMATGWKKRVAPGHGIEALRSQF